MKNIFSEANIAPIDSIYSVGTNGGLLSMKEAAKYIHVSNSTMEKLSANMMIPKFRPNRGKVYFLKNDLDTYVMTSRIKSRSELEQEALTFNHNYNGK